MKPEHLKLLADKDWRLNNLYWITDKEGKPTRFRMTPEQREYFEGIHTRNIILKARQLGFTTEVCIIRGTFRVCEVRADRPHAERCQTPVPREGEVRIRQAAQRNQGGEPGEQ